MWINFHTYLPGKYNNGEYTYHKPNLTLRALLAKKNANRPPRTFCVDPLKSFFKKTVENAQAKK